MGLRSNLAGPEGGTQPLTVLFVSQISYPVALAILGEVRSQADSGAIPAQNILWHSPETGEVLGRLWEKMVSLHHEVWQPGSPRSFPQSLSLPTTPSCRKALCHHAGPPPVSQTSGKLVQCDLWWKVTPSSLQRHMRPPNPILIATPGCKALGIRTHQGDVYGSQMEVSRQCSGPCCHPSINLGADSMSKTFRKCRLDRR